MRAWWSAALGIVALSACSTDGNRAVLADEKLEEQATSATKALIQAQLDTFAEATAALRDAAPAPDADGWNATADASAVDAMRAAWKEARTAYDGVLVPARILFPDLHRSLDTDYDDLLAEGGDPFLFDEHGVHGLQAVERILWSDLIPADVVAHEASLGGMPAAFPANENEAAEAKDELFAKLAADAEALRDGFRATSLDPVTAYRGATESIEEQLGQLEEAGKGEGKARYAGRSLADLRASFAATEATYAAFRPWILAKEGGPHSDEGVTEGLARLGAAYAEPEGDALPPTPEGFSGTAPSDAMLATPFGKLFDAARTEANAETDGTLRFEMLEAGGLLGVIMTP